MFYIRSKAVKNRERKGLITRAFFTAVWMTVIVPFLCSSGFASDAPYTENKTVVLRGNFGTTHECTARAYQAEITDLELSNLPAKLCFSPGEKDTKENCFKAVTEVNGTSYSFQFVDSLYSSSLSKTNDRQALVFIAKFSGGGSGSLRLITLWLYDKEVEGFVNVLPVVAISEQGEYKMLPQSKKIPGDVLVTADYVWGERETHFSPHHYQITMYGCTETGKFVLAGKYVTKRKYKSLDDVDKIDVIRHELENVRRNVAIGR